jgi:hypothetical protein
MRYIAMGLSVAIMLTLATPPVFAQITSHGHTGAGSANSGFCPKGSCAPSGGPYAKNVSKCSPAHCKR